MAVLTNMVSAGFGEMRSGLKRCGVMKDKAMVASRVIGVERVVFGALLF